MDLTNGYMLLLRFSVRLYEGSNKIELYYDQMDPFSPGCDLAPNSIVFTAGVIGLSTENGYIGVQPGEGVVTGDSDYFVDLLTNPIDPGTLYTFEVGTTITGDTDEGGTEEMADGDSLLIGETLAITSSADFEPFSIHTLPCAPVVGEEVTYSITGPGALDYSINPTSEPMPGGTTTPVLTFAPIGLGIRSATLTVSFGSTTLNYDLVAEGVSKNYVGRKYSGRRDS